MKTTNEKLNIMRSTLKDRNARIMIIGLGSVGNYLLDYLLSTADERMDICVVGRDEYKMQSDVNIAKIASMIRGKNRSQVSIISNVDLGDVASITNALQKFQPDIIVNSSRAYSGLKYGSISWGSIRAYGLWAPLAVRFTKNIMKAYEQAMSDAIVINTSYSDAIIPWLKTAGKAYPDFGSGNINHLIPRIKFAVAEEFHINDSWNIDITFAVSHFHDVVISKEGHSEGVDMLIDEIIEAILSAVRDGKKRKLHCPGVFGEIGGYPVMVDGETGDVKTYICEDYFPLEEMRKKNRESIYLDGIENVEDGTLTYTDELITKVKQSFGVNLEKKVNFNDIDHTASFIIREIIERNQ